MAVGTSLLALLGNKDPREALLQAVAGGGPLPQAVAGAPYAGGMEGGGPTTTPQAAGGAGAPPPQPADTMASPPELAKMFQDIMSYDSKARNIDRGFGLIGSSISQDGNREATLQSFIGDGGNPGANQMMGGIAESVAGIRKQNLLAQQRAAMMASLPGIAKKYGLDLSTAQYLYDTGKLDAVIAEAEKPDRELRELGNGQVALIEKGSGQQVGTFGDPKQNIQQVSDPALGQVAIDLNNPTDKGRVLAGPDNRTTDTKNYDAYVIDETKAGRTPLSFDDWGLRSKKAGAASTTVNNQPGENAFTKKLGEYDAEDVQRYNKAADNAMDMLNSFDAIESGLNTGIRTGSFGETENALRRFGQSVLGMNEDDTAVAGGELVQKMSNRMALLMRNPESGMGMPGSVSDKDIDFLKASQVGLGTSEAGNKLSLEVFRRLEKRKMEYAEEAEKWAAANGGLRGFRAHARKLFEEKPMFDDLKKDVSSATGQAAPLSAEAIAAQEKALIDKWRKK